MLFFLYLCITLFNDLSMSKKKILHIAQEISPYVTDTVPAETELGIIQSMAEAGCEVRVFMPRWGNVNERRNQLHEVIRLSGVNIVIDDTDHPLIIKVASIQSARTQVYFIDNDDFFHRRLMGYDEEGSVYADNGSRAVFYARGVLETVKKLRWNPDIIHCHGWISAVAVLYLKTAYRDYPQFANAKIVFSAYDDMLTGVTLDDFASALLYREVNKELVGANMPFDFTKGDALSQIALTYADAYVQSGEQVDPSITAFAAEKGLPSLAYTPRESVGEAYCEFYDRIIAGE